ncbi:ABC transporter ATP-binding protein [Lottiidibacillus patelloidae]|uniref:ABC transporter ATP-binding protein n=1 Tax=Lottiidibacillus patelloidae TaxID=2670334 RepID=A0A263BRD6_9BACI|nr:ABC transporter ATP-binding protein [Lottiidibacillus patelloidae]OZM56265.1 ABC transporter ATP-binding protein [Lottiidibacillus patelloidae]
MLNVNHICKVIDEKPVLQDISFSIAKGSIVGLVGENGAGKTTLLRCLVGILELDKGEITFNNKNIMTEPEVKKSIIYIPDSHHNFNSYSVKEISSLYEAIYPNFDMTYFHSLLERFNLPANKQLRNFSKGMKALFFIILAISAKVELIILDEPTNGLDAIVKRNVLQLLLEEVSEQNISLLISSHHLNELEKITDTVLLMKNGKINSTFNMDEVDKEYKKIQVVFKGDFPSKLKSLTNLQITNHTGRVYTVVLKGKANETLSLLKEENPLVIEELPMSLEDIFITEIGG